MDADRLHMAGSTRSGRRRRIPREPERLREQTTVKPTSPADHVFEFTLDRNWRIASISESAARWCGSTAGDLVGRDSREAWPAPQKPVVQAVEAAFATGATTVLEQPSLFAPGRWVRVEIARSKDGARFRFRDITSRQSSERPTQPSEKTGAYSLGLAPAEIIVLDRQGVIVSVDSAWCAALAAHGIDVPNAGRGMRYADVCKLVLPGLDKAAFQQRLEALLSGRVPRFEATYSLDTPHGRELRQLQIAPLQHAATNYFAAIHEDLTERARILAELDETSDELLHAQESERRRIAVELHDSTSQDLAALVLGLHNLKRTVGKSVAARRSIDEMVELAQQAVRETRVLSFLMNASGDHREGLEASVRRFVEGFGRRTGLMASFEAEGPVDPVSAAVQHAAFRVVQEALSNVYRHARATKAVVSLVNQARVLSVRVSDDGQGFEPPTGVGEGEAPPLGVGIPGMRARIEQLGGDLWVAGGRGGTVVIATIPVGRRDGSQQPGRLPRASAEEATRRTRS